MLLVNDVNVRVDICIGMHTKTINICICLHIDTDTHVWMHRFRSELLRSPMALKILRKGDVIRLKQATSLHSVQIFSPNLIGSSHALAFQNWGAALLKKFLGEPSRASRETLIVLPAFHSATGGTCEGRKTDHVHDRTPFHRQPSRCVSGTIRESSWKKCACNTSTKDSGALAPGNSCRYYKLTAFVICHFVRSAGWQTLVHAPGIHQWRRMFSWPTGRFESCAYNTIYCIRRQS